MFPRYSSGRSCIGGPIDIVTTSARIERVKPIIKDISIYIALMKPFFNIIMTITMTITILKKCFLVTGYHKQMNRKCNNTSVYLKG